MLECEPYVTGGKVIKIVHQGNIYCSILPTHRGFTNANRVIADYCIKKGYKFYLSSWNVWGGRWYKNFLTLVEPEDYMLMVAKIMNSVCHNHYTNAMIEEFGYYESQRGIEF